MSFSSSQQGIYRPLVAAAWALHCARSGVPAKDKAAYSAWYSAELRKATGHGTTRTLNKGRHYERACAHFEDLADAGIVHQLALIQGDLRRIRFSVGKVNPGYLARFATDADLERYAKGIAAQATRRESPELYQLDDAEIQTVTRAICIDAHRVLAA